MGEAKWVVVLGGGFGGVEAAIQLRKRGYRVTLVSERDYLYLYPVSIWIPVGGLRPEAARISLAELATRHGFTLQVQPVVEIAAAARRVRLENGELSGFDALVVAIGSGKLRARGSEHMLSICGRPEEAVAIRERLAALIEAGSGRVAVGFGGNPKDRSAVRGGPAFELILNIDHHLRKRRVRDAFTLTMFAPMPKPGIRMGEKAYAAVGGFLEGQGIARHFGKKIVAFEGGGIRFEGEELLPSDLTVFIAAGTGHSLIAASDLPTTEAGFIRIDDHCEVEGMPNVFAVGDVAALEPLPWAAKQGHTAEVMARVAAEALANRDAGREPTSGYKAHLGVLCVMDYGRGAVWVARDGKRERFVPLPWLGHQLKKGWGSYWKGSRNGAMFRLPGM